jgi:hypothetical protein
MSKTMMTTAHPPEDTLRAHLHGELPPAEDAEAVAHVEACAACRSRLDVLRREEAEAQALLATLDVPAPTDLAWKRVQRRTRGGAGGGRTLLRAAVVLLIAGGTLSAAVPGSPVRDWIEGAVRGEEAAPTVTATREAAPAHAPEEAAVSIVPEAAARVVLDGVAPGTPVVLRLHDGDRLRLHTTGDVAARFGTAANRIEASLAGVASIRVEIPRVGPPVTLEVNGEVMARREAGELRLPTGTTRSLQANGDEVVVEVPR